MVDESYATIVRRTARDGAAADLVSHPLTPAEKRTIAAALEALSSEPSLDMNHVRIGIDGRELVLRGNVPGPATRARVEAIANQVDGVDRVDNQLAVHR
ncbi:MAG: BON domain-containing protein [Kofleriaceae bacterium]